jgi:secreted PhoX family phosphatase
MTNEMNLSRRTLLAVSAAAAATTATLTGTAVAALPVHVQNPDPAIVAVRECQASEDAFEAAIYEQDIEGSDEDYDVLDRRADEAADTHRQAWRRVLTVTPTTVAGMATLASYMAKYNTEAGGADTGEEALTALAASLQRFATAVEREGSHG